MTDAMRKASANWLAKMPDQAYPAHLPRIRFTQSGDTLYIDQLKHKGKAKRNKDQLET